MSAIPGGELCLTKEGEQLQQQMTYQSSLAILGLCLPLAIIVCLVAGLSVRRCVSCYSATCVSSFCKEELALALLTLPLTAAQILLFIPGRQSFTSPHLSITDKFPPQFSTQIWSSWGCQ